MNNKTILIGLGLVVVLVVFLMFGSGYKKTVAPETTTQPPSQTQEIDKTTDTTDQTIVVLTANGFEPKTVTIKVGQTVAWENESGAPATVNSSVHPTHKDYPALNLSRFSPGQSLSLTFNKAGSFKYHDHLNASSTGVVIVQ